ncbi:putative signal transducing protein [Novipirellula artificiosorum]|uniref:DUF2007 domain-containing protein n=1 Tax=Novipirellula artificiosorum TaxID=2528016 RepID=A0A5C6CX23_9BACT|nr:DUF2007 domain-containing protein [Novipirellula artificiosorum]TWU27981.1 hypothetical protein Poly41_69630 [Novipirellula artificiosorum]
MLYAGLREVTTRANVVYADAGVGKGRSPRTELVARGGGVEQFIVTADVNDEAHLLCGLLQNEGIEARVVGDHIRSVLGHLDIGAVAPRILVPPDRYEEARKTVLAHEARHESSSKSAEQWERTHCGELNEPRSGVCWKCQTEHVYPAE